MTSATGGWTWLRVGTLVGLAYLLYAARSVLPPFVVALAHGGVQVAVGVVLLYFVLRQIEDQLAMPLVVSRTAELHPAVPVVVIVNVIRLSLLAESAGPDVVQPTEG